jgi:transcriptional regulator GlxA family with amidase domain
LFDTIYAMDVKVLVLDGVFDVGLSAVLDTVTMANELASGLNFEVAPFQLSMVGAAGVSGAVRTAQGLSVPVSAAASSTPPDAVVLPALGAKQPGSLIHALAQPNVLDACAQLRDLAGVGVWVGAACTSTFVLAESGLLDGHRATTSWWLAPCFRQRYPRVELDESRMLMNSAPFVTAGAALAHIDLALHLVRQVSPTLAALTARYLLVEPRASQAPFVMPDHLAHEDVVVERFEQWARGHLAQGFDLAEAARCVGASERTLSRRMRAVLGKSPLAFFQDLRIQYAVHRLQTSADSVEQIAAAVGYADGVTLRALLRTRLGRGVREIRDRAAG